MLAGPDTDLPSGTRVLYHQDRGQLNISLLEWLVTARSFEGGISSPIRAWTGP